MYMNENMFITARFARDAEHAEENTLIHCREIPAMNKQSATKEFRPDD